MERRNRHGLLNKLSEEETVGLVVETNHLPDSDNPVTMETLAAQLRRLHEFQEAWMGDRENEMHSLRERIREQEQEIHRLQGSYDNAGRHSYHNPYQNRHWYQWERYIRDWWQPTSRSLYSPRNETSRRTTRHRLDWIQVALFLFLVLNLHSTFRRLEFESSVIKQTELIKMEPKVVEVKVPVPVPHPNPHYGDYYDHTDDYGGWEHYETRKGPKESKPPDSIPLMETNGNKYVQRRHECIQRIRQQQDQMLSPYFSGFSNDRVLLVDPAYHANVGDHMLTLGEFAFLKTLNIDRPHECQLCQSGGYINSCANLVEYGELGGGAVRRQAMWHAGGNWGDLWRTAQEVRVQSFEWLLQNNFTVVGMPQSFFYRNETKLMNDTKRIKKFVETHTKDHTEAKKRVVLTWREQESYDKAIKEYPFVSNFLVPDIAFQLGPFAPDPPKEGGVELVDFLFFLRDDLESTLNDYRSREAIQEMLDKAGVGDKTFRIVDWPDRYGLFGSSDIFFTQTSIQLLSSGRVVVCDRLHAAILAYLAGLPLVFVDQLSGKISKTLRVAFSSSKDCMDEKASMWAQAEDLKGAISKAVQFFSDYEL